MEEVEVLLGIERKEGGEVVVAAERQQKRHTHRGGSDRDRGSERGSKTESRVSSDAGFCSLIGCAMMPWRGSGAPGDDQKLGAGPRPITLLLGIGGQLIVSTNYKCYICCKLKKKKKMKACLSGLAVEVFAGGLDA